jgi:hypothetical protein
MPRQRSVECVLENKKKSEVVKSFERAEKVTRFYPPPCPDYPTFHHPSQPRATNRSATVPPDATFQLLRWGLHRNGSGTSDGASAPRRSWKIIVSLWRVGRLNRCQQTGVLVTFMLLGCDCDRWAPVIGRVRKPASRPFGLQVHSEGSRTPKFR